MGFITESVKPHQNPFVQFSEGFDAMRPGKLDRNVFGQIVGPLLDDVFVIDFWAKD